MQATERVLGFVGKDINIIAEDEDDIKPPALPSNLIGSFGDPSLWAQSTLKDADEDDLVAVYTIGQGFFLGGESIRNRMWLHDLLDDKEIPYYIEVGRIGGGKAMVEAQVIYVEKRHAPRVVNLINEYNDPISIVSISHDDSDDTFNLVDGVPQIICPKCAEEIDFDYHKCPYCKSSVG